MSRQGRLYLIESFQPRAKYWTSVLLGSSLPFAVRQTYKQMTASKNKILDGDKKPTAVKRRNRTEHDGTRVTTN